MCISSFLLFSTMTKHYVFLKKEVSAGSVRLLWWLGSDFPQKKKKKHNDTVVLKIGRGVFHSTSWVALQGLKEVCGKKVSDFRDSGACGWQLHYSNIFPFKKVNHIHDPFYFTTTLFINGLFG